MKRLVARESFKMIGKSMELGTASVARRVFRKAVNGLLPLIDHHEGRGLIKEGKRQRRKHLFEKIL